MTMGLNMEVSEEVACCTTGSGGASDDTVEQSNGLSLVFVSLQCCLDNTLKPSLTGFLHHLKIHLLFREIHLIISISYESAFYLLV